jgi:hypothetical protein
VGGGKLCPAWRIRPLAWRIRPLAWRRSPLALGSLRLRLAVAVLFSAVRALKRCERISGGRQDGDSGHDAFEREDDELETIRAVCCFQDL